MHFIFILLILGFSHFLSSYDSRYDSGKYFVINNKFLARLLISDTTFVDRRKILKNDRNKITIVGFCSYIFAVILTIVTVVFALLPDIPCKPFSFTDDGIVFFTANLKIPTLLSFMAMTAEIFFVLRVLFNCNAIRAIEYKWIRILLKSVFVLLMVVCVLSVGYLFCELFAA